jgi:ribosomal protein S18 acetylase RimI-like enzyme
MPTAPHPLHNVVWNALCSGHSGLALGGELARRYPPRIAAFVAVRDASPAAQAALAALVEAGEEVLMIDAPGPAPGDTFELMMQKELVQMVAPVLEGEPHDESRFEPLGDADISQMLALVEQTQPGPFRERTIDFGGFIGHKPGGRLVAMGGRRLQPDTFIEISGICTDPAWRGQGLARDVVLVLARRIAAEGRTPILHAFADNHAAIALYEKLGFVVRARPMAMRLRRRG